VALIDMPSDEGEFGKVSNVITTRPDHDAVAPSPLCDHAVELAKLAISERRFRLLAEQFPLPVMLTDGGGVISFANERLRAFMGDDAQETIWDLFILEDAVYLKRLWRAARLPDSLEVVLQTCNGGTAKIHARPVVDDDGAIDTVVCTIEDLTAHMAGLKAMTELAHLDAVTRLPNRLGIEASWEQLSREYEMDASLDRPAIAAVIFVDLDGFKGVNDTFGHAAGDEVLIEVGRRLALGARSDDMVGRYGGDEFIGIFRGISDPDDAIAVVERLRSQLCHPLVHSRGTWNAQASFGLAIARAEESLGDVVRRADEAMYREKQRRRSRLSIIL
jgi:diguanylate cyclase (GGDEF)-like protein